MTDEIPRVGSTCSPWAGLGDMSCQTYGADTTKLEQCLQFSTDVLNDLTGGRWPGRCVETIRPAATWVPSGMSGLAPLVGWWPGDGFMAGPFDGQAARGSWGRCTCNRSARTGCYLMDEIRLADRVLEVIEVRVDGAVVPSIEYRLDDHRYLVGLQQADGSRRTWPCCQRDDLEDTEVGTFSIQFARGGLPPIGGTLASASLACELAKGMGYLGDEAAKKCRLPRRVTQITRQNVSVAVLDPLTLFQDGRTGLAEVDLWVASVQQGSSRRRGTMIRMGRPRRPRHPGT